MFFLFTLVIYGLGLVLTAVGGRLTGRCATWCCALCGAAALGGQRHGGVALRGAAAACAGISGVRGWASRGWLWARRWPAQ